MTVNPSSWVFESELDQNPEVHSESLTSGRDSVLWAGQGRCWGSNHRPGHKRGASFLSDWTQMHSDISRDTRPSAPSGHQPVVSHIQTTSTPTTLFPPPSISLTTATSHWGPLRLLHPRDAPCCELLQLAVCPVYTFHSAFIQAASLWFHHFQSALLVAISEQRGMSTSVGWRREQRVYIITLLIFSFGCVRSAGKWLRASQLSTTWVCSSVPVTMFPTALRAAVWR